MQLKAFYSYLTQTYTQDWTGICNVAKLFAGPLRTLPHKGGCRAWLCAFRCSCGCLREQCSPQQMPG